MHTLPAWMQRLLAPNIGQFFLQSVGLPTGKFSSIGSGFCDPMGIQEQNYANDLRCKNILQTKAAWH
jgi:hypothetical protein